MTKCAWLHCVFCKSNRTLVGKLNSLELKKTLTYHSFKQIWNDLNSVVKGSVLFEESEYLCVFDSYTQSGITN